jgi:hypothetical protein
MDNSGLNNELAAAMRAGHQQTFGQVQLQVLPLIDLLSQVGLAAFKFGGQVNLDRGLAERTVVGLEHGMRIERPEIGGNGKKRANETV